MSSAGPPLDWETPLFDIGESLDLRTLNKHKRVSPFVREAGNQGSLKAVRPIALFVPLAKRRPGNCGYSYLSSGGQLTISRRQRTTAASWTPKKPNRIAPKAFSEELPSWAGRFLHEIADIVHKLLPARRIDVDHMS